MRKTINLNDGFNAEIKALNLAREHKHKLVLSIGEHDLKKLIRPQGFVYSHHKVIKTLNKRETNKYFKLCDKIKKANIEYRDFKESL